MKKGKQEDYTHTYSEEDPSNGYKESTKTRTRVNPNYGYGNFSEFRRDRLINYDPYTDYNNEGYRRTGNFKFQPWGDTSAGPYRGVGPKGYKLSDDRIIEDIHDVLTEHSHLDATHIGIEVKRGEVILSGTVNNKNEKRLAEDISESVAGVENVENRIRVMRQPASHDN